MGESPWGKRGHSGTVWGGAFVGMRARPGGFNAWHQNCALGSRDAPQQGLGTDVALRKASFATKEKPWIVRGIVE